MTRSQLELIKKSTYFFLVLGLGGSVLWLSSGGNMFQADLITTNAPVSLNANQNQLTVTTGGILGATSGQDTSFTQGSATNTNINEGLYGSATSTLGTESTSISSVVNASSSSSSSENEGFASLAETSVYTGELNSPESSAYTDTATLGVSNTVNTNSTLAQVDTSPELKQAAQVITTTQAKIPESGPAEILLLCAALTLTFGIMYFRKLAV